MDTDVSIPEALQLSSGHLTVGLCLLSQLTTTEHSHA